MPRAQVGHIHTGGLNISLSVNGETVCTSFPTYGATEGVAGDEKGYLVRMSHCLDSATRPLELRKGDVVSVDGYYYVGSHDPRLLYSDGTHLNVMSYMYLGYYRPAESVHGDWDAAFWAEHKTASKVVEARAA